MYLLQNLCIALSAGCAAVLVWAEKSVSQEVGTWVASTFAIRRLLRSALQHDSHDDFTTSRLCSTCLATPPPMAGMLAAHL